MSEEKMTEEEFLEYMKKQGFFAKASIHRNDRVEPVPLRETSNSLILLLHMLSWKETWIPTGIAALIVLYWSAFNAAQSLIPIIGIWSTPIIWVVVLSPLEAFAIYVKLYQRREKGARLFR